MGILMALTFTPRMLPRDISTRLDFADVDSSTGWKRHRIILTRDYRFELAALIERMTVHTDRNTIDRVWVQR